VIYRELAGMSTSVVGMGCNQLGVTCDAEGAAALVREALDSGINYFDVADEYGRKYWDATDPTWGLAEEYLGRALRGRRDEALIATKFGVRPPTKPELGGASAKWIATAVEDSLRRLETDRLDLYQLHLPDPTVPIGETLTALDALVRAGKVRAIGCSNLSGEQLQEAHDVASDLGTAHFVSTQERLNLFAQDALNDVMPVCDRLGMKFIPYQPLARGVLTGKYGRGKS
jgi:aryl-alcohol dehydrogenase-like predicted oxidoreductase